MSCPLDGEAYGTSAPDLNRIQVPSDMVNGMSVGAASTRDSNTNYSRAPYSAVGPGRWGARIQPLGVCFGGDDNTNRFLCLGPQGQRIEWSGTSFAAPLAIHGLCHLQEKLRGSALDSHTLKAFAAHFAQRRSKLHVEQELGYGLLRERYEDILSCPTNEVTVIYHDTLRHNEVAGFTLPFPIGIDPQAQVKIQWTLCYTTRVDPAEAQDYTQAGVSVVFRPHARRIPVTYTDANQIRVFDIEEERDAFENAIASGGVPGRNPASDSGREMKINEQRLRDAGKWETLIQHRFGRASAKLFWPRLDLSYFVRDGGSLVSPNSREDLDFTLLVSVKAPQGTKLYEMVTNQFPILTPVTLQIET